MCLSQPIIFVSSDQSKDESSNAALPIERCFKKSENKIKFAKVKQP